LKTHDNVWGSFLCFSEEIEHNELWWKDVKEFVDHFLYNSILSGSSTATSSSGAGEDGEE
jgi:hypothetical protein